MEYKKIVHNYKDLNSLNHELLESRITLKEGYMDFKITIIMKIKIMTI